MIFEKTRADLTKLRLDSESELKIWLCWSALKIQNMKIKKKSSHYNYNVVGMQYY